MEEVEKCVFVGRNDKMQAADIIEASLQRVFQLLHYYK